MSKISDKLGFSIIELMFSLGLSTIVGLAMFSLVQSQNKEVRALNQQLSSRDLEIGLRSLISANNKFCGCLLRNLTINSMTTPPNITSSNLVSDIPNGYDAACNPIGGSYIVTNFARADEMNVAVSSISIGNLTSITAGKYSADITLILDKTKLVRELKPIKVKVMLNMNTANPSNLTLNSCGSPLPEPNIQAPGDWCGSGTQGSRHNDRHPLLCFGHNPRYSCPPGYYQAFVGEADGVHSYTCIKN
ncbi:MAG: PilW family protein [Pseudobdellovibrio sp.]